jgi:hypothetical protein
MADWTAFLVILTRIARPRRHQRGQAPADAVSCCRTVQLDGRQISGKFLITTLPSSRPKPAVGEGQPGHRVHGGGREQRGPAGARRVRSPGPCPSAASRASQPVEQDRAVAAKACRSAGALHCSAARPCASIADRPLAHEDAGLKLDSVGRIAPTPQVGESGNVA